MSKIVEEVLNANREYQANSGDQGALALAPARASRS
jgi:hypothetical protein